MNKWFHIFSVFFRLFLWYRRLCTTLFDLISRLCAVCFWFPVLVRCLFDPGWKISFEQLQIRSVTMTLASSTLQIQRQYFGDLNIVMLVIFVGISTFPFYAINMDVVSLFTDSSFLFLANLYRCTLSIWMNEYRLFLSKKKICTPRAQTPQTHNNDKRVRIQIITRNQCTWTTLNNNNSRSSTIKHIIHNSHQF